MAQSEHSPETTESVVVVMDDNDDLRHMLTLALETAGFDVLAARTQIELQRLLAQRRPDALIINLQRSEKDGLDLLERMRARRSLDDVPILFMSGVDADDFRQQVLAAGADWFELRPIGMVELQKQVSRVIRRGRRTARHEAAAPRRVPQVTLRRTG
jgi:DNA-binding response OmpR family regulator